MKKLIFPLIATFVFAGEYITLDDGKVIYLKDDGTWQEVQVVKKGGKTIALRPDGTWEEIEPTKFEAAQAVETATDKKFKDDPLVKKLLGRWEGEGIVYEFAPDTAVLRLREGKAVKVYEGKWVVESLDPKSGRITIRIGTALKVGPLAFGGTMRKLRLAGDTLVDESEKVEGRVYKLRKVK